MLPPVSAELCFELRGAAAPLGGGGVVKSEDLPAKSLQQEPVVLLEGTLLLAFGPAFDPVAHLGQREGAEPAMVLVPLQPRPYRAGVLPDFGVRV